MESNYTPYAETGGEDQTRAEPEYDENGEEILYKAECNKCNVICGVCFLAFLASTAALAVILILPCLFLICCAKVKNWKLYLTKRGIHHVKPGGYGCCTSHWFISLEEIQEITWVESNLHVKVGPEKVS